MVRLLFSFPDVAGDDVLLHRGPVTEQHMPPAGPRAPEPVFNIPRVVLGVLALLGLAYLVQWGVGLEREFELMADLAVVPARMSIALGLTELRAVAEAAQAAAGPGEGARALALVGYFVRGQDANWWSVLTYALLHSGPLHLALNGIWLAVFGSPVARRVGAPGFLTLLAIGAAAGAATHALLHPLDFAPLIGASAAVSATMGAAARFVFSGRFHPAALADDDAIRRLPTLGFAAMIANRQALAFVLVWFLGNWLFGSGVAPIAGVDQSIAWEAHVGGFLAGLLLFPLFDRRRLRR